MEKLNQFTGGNGMLFVDTIFNAADRSNDRLISFTEWSDGIRQVKPDIPEAQLRKVFDTIDSNNSGELSLAEFKAKLKEGYEYMEAHVPSVAPGSDPVEEVECGVSEIITRDGTCEAC